MSAHDLTAEDTAAMRRQGDDWRLYLRGQIAQSRARREQKPVSRRLAGPPGHRPGVWPPGIRPPDPPSPIPEAEVARAVAEYRDWVNAGSPPVRHHCACPNCQLLEGDTT